MDEKFKQRLERILDFYDINLDRDAIRNDMLELMDDVYFQGWSDSKDDSADEEAFSVV